MDLDNLFSAYYTQYRGVAQIPASTDDEYTIFTSLANEAINRWASYDNTYWNELFSTLQAADDGDKVITTSTTYAAPSNMKEAGGTVRINNSNGHIVRRYPIIQPNEAQFKNDASFYCYFTGNSNDGFILTLNPAPDSAIIGLPFDYIYYSLPNLLSSGSDTPQMAEPYFIVHRALANRFRNTRNPYYGGAKNDAEDVLKIMQMNNNSGNWADPWKLADNSGSTWGQTFGS